MKQVRVLHVVEASGGGVLSVVLDSIAALQRAYPARFTFTIAFSRRNETPVDLERANPDVRFVEMAMGRRFFSLRDLRIAAQLARLASGHDVVHCHSSRAGFIGRLSRICGNRRRILYSPHCYAFLATDFSLLTRCLIAGVEMALSWTPGSVTIACGDSEYRLAKRMGGRTQLIRNGYDADVKLAQTQPRSGFLVVGSGRRGLQKDPEMFLRIAERMRGREIAFRWIGDLGESDVATGWLPREEAKGCLAGGDVFLITSRWEGLPVAGLEAMSLGLPLVVRDAPGARDLVAHGVNGFVFRDAQEAVERLTQLATDADLRRRMGRASLSLLHEKFSATNYLELDNLYGATLSRGAHAVVSN